jgi:HEAT repeat protein
MGTSAAAKRAATRRMTFKMTRCRRRDVKAKRKFAERIKTRRANFLFALYIVITLFVINVFPQQSEIDFLAQKITRGSDEQKRDALAQIRNLKSAEASKIAAAALNDSSEIVRATAAAAVIFIPKDEAAKILIPLLADKKPLVRREAAYALGKVGDSLAVNPLLQTLQTDKVTEVRGAAVVALGEIGDVAAISELVKILRRKPQSNEEFQRRSAARAIGQIAQILQTGKTKTLTPENFLPDELKSLEKMQYPKLAETFPVFRPAISVLIQTLQNPQEFADVKREAAFALGAIGDLSAVPALQANANNADYYLAEICRESLRKINFLF